MPNKDYPDNYSQPVVARRCIETNNLSAYDLEQFIPNAKEKSKEKKSFKATRQKDKGKYFDSFKVRATSMCNICDTTLFMFSELKVGSNG